MASLYSVSQNYDKVDFELDSFKIDGKIDYLTCAVSFEMTYKNNAKDVVDCAYFEFPIGEFIIYHFKVKINEETLVGVCRPTGEAEDTYQEAVEAGYQAFMGQQDELSKDLFKLSLGNVPAKATVSICMKLTCLLKLTDNTILFTVPTVCRDRYTLSESRIKREFGKFQHWIKQNPQKFHFNLRVTMPAEINKLTSERYQITPKFSDDRKTVDVKLDLDKSPVTDHYDLQMTIQLTSNSLRSTFSSYELGLPSSSSSTTSSPILSTVCLAAHFHPNFDDLMGSGDASSSSADRRPSDKTEIVILIDRSGSMSGSRMRFAKQSLLLLLKSLPKDCRFQLIGYGSTAVKLFDKAAEANRENLEKAITYQTNIKADMGGTEAYGALKMAFTDPKLPEDEGWVREIVYITDGEIYQVTEVIAMASKHADHTRVFTIGIGHGVSEALINGVAEACNGRGVCVREDSQLQPAVMQVLQAILQPKARQVRVEWDLKQTQSLDDVVPTQPVSLVSLPTKLPNLYSGQVVTCYALVKDVNSSGYLFGSVRLTFKLPGQGRRDNDLVTLTCGDIKVKLDEAKGNDLPLHRLAGQCQLNQLLDAYSALEIDDDETGGGGEKHKLASLRAAIEQVSTELTLASRFTSFVVVDTRQPVTKSKPIGKRLSARGGGGDDFPDCASSPIKSNAMACCGSNPLSARGGKSSLFGSSDAGLFSARRGNDVPDCGMVSSDSGCRSSFSMLPADSRSPSSMTNDVIVALAQLQDFDGYWSSSSTDVSVEGTTSVQLLLGGPKQQLSITDLIDKVKQSLCEVVDTAAWTSTLDQRVFLTCLVIVYFQTKLASREVEWKLLVDKAITWLQGHVNVAQGQSIDQLLDAARHVLTTSAVADQ